MIATLARQILAVILIFCVLGCRAQTAEQTLQLQWKFHSPTLQALFIKELESRQIPFSISSDGYVLYTRKEMKKVDKARAVVLAWSNRPKAHYPYKELKKQFIALLRRENVSLTEETIDGKDWVVWQRKDDERVKELSADVDQGVTREALQRMEQKSDGLE